MYFSGFLCCSYILHTSSLVGDINLYFHFIFFFLWNKKTKHYWQQQKQFNVRSFVDFFVFLNLLLAFGFLWTSAERTSSCLVSCLLLSFVHCFLFVLRFGCLLLFDLLLLDCREINQRRRCCWLRWRVVNCLRLSECSIYVCIFFCCKWVYPNISYLCRVLSIVSKWFH